MLSENNTDTVTVRNLLLVREPWASLILSGFKKWEIRGSSVSCGKRTTIAIAKSGERGVHRIYGLIDIVDVKGPLSISDLKENLALHRDPSDTQKLPYAKTYAWVLANPRALRQPIDYEYKNGWVIWGIGYWTFKKSDFVESGSFVTMPSPDPILRQKFMQSLSDDLSYFGYTLQDSNICGRGLTTLKIPDFKKMSWSYLKEILHSGYVALQEKNRKCYETEILRVRKIIEAKNLITETPVPINELNLVLRPVKSKDDKDVHWYFRLLQNIPSSKSIGRVMDAIIYHVPLCDVENKNCKEHVFGIIGLGSTSYTSGGRDTLFGWNDKDDVSSKKKQSALRSILQINCILVAPAYDREEYRFTKLLAMAVFSSEIVNQFKDKYKSPMLAAISTAGFGLNAYMFQRITFGALKGKIKKLACHTYNRNQQEAHDFWALPAFERGGRRRNNNYVYYKEAVTSNLCMNIVSDLSKELSKKYCDSSGSIKKMSGANKALARALHFSGINESIFSIAPRGIYIGMLCNQYIRILSTGETAGIDALSIPWNDIFHIWRKMEIKRMKNRMKGGQQ